MAAQRPKRPNTSILGNVYSFLVPPRPGNCAILGSPHSVNRDTTSAQRVPCDTTEPGQDMTMINQLREFTFENQELRLEKRIAEREKKEASKQLEELQNRNQELAHEAEGLSLTLEKLRGENRLLKEELNDAQSHIFSLQPYRKEPTSREVSQQYCDLVEEVQDWVLKFMDPWLNDLEAGATTLMTKASQNPREALKFRIAISEFPDLVHGALFPETDEDIIAAMIMRFLNSSIFQETLYGSIEQYTEVVRFIENAMQASVEPKRDLFAVRTWTAEAYNAFLSSPQFHSIRSNRSQALSEELAEVLRIFCDESQFPQFCDEMEDRCVLPAMQLYEKLLVASNFYYLQIDPYIARGTRGSFVPSSAFYANVDDLDCENILQNRKTFIASKLNPQPTKEQLHQELLNVCTIAPALCVRQIGQRDNIKAPAVVCKQRMLVAWGSEEKRQSFFKENARTLIARLCFEDERRG